MSCSRTQHGGGRSRTPDLSLRSPTLYHWATALPWKKKKKKKKKKTMWCDVTNPLNRPLPIPDSLTFSLENLGNRSVAIFSNISLTSFCVMFSCVSSSDNLFTILFIFWYEGLSEKCPDSFASHNLTRICILIPFSGSPLIQLSLKLSSRETGLWQSDNKEQ